MNDVTISPQLAIDLHNLIGEGCFGNVQVKAIRGILGQLEQAMQAASKEPDDDPEP